MQNVEREYAKNRIINEGLKYFPAFVATVYNERTAVKCADKLICLNNRDSYFVEKIYHKKSEDLFLEQIMMVFTGLLNMSCRNLKIIN